jgi:hypothetical protein
MTSVSASSSTSKVAPVILGDAQTQPFDAAGSRIAMIMRLIGRFTELINDGLRGRCVRIPHAKINDIVTGTTRFQLQLVNDGKHIGWETINSYKALHILPLTIRPHTRQGNRWQRL